MKKFTLILVAFLFIAFGVVQEMAQGYEDQDYSGDYYKDQVIKILDQMQEEKENPPKVFCPTGIRNQASCLTCHTSPRFKLKEPEPNETLNLPYNTDIIVKNGERVGYYYLTDIEDTHFKRALDYLTRHGISKLVLEVNSPGGSLFLAWRIVGMMRSWMDGGKRTIETHCYGFAMSAGFLIFSSGTKGSRLVSPTCEGMWHELISFKMFAIETPSSTEEQSRILRHLQDTGNSWLSNMSNMSKDEIDAAVEKKEFWLRGTEMVERGFADGYLDQ